MNDSIQYLRTSLLGKTRADLEAVLDLADKDGDRTLHIAELGAFMIALGVEFTETELSAASNSMSALDDGDVPLGLRRIVALYCRSSTSNQIC
jgi:hypothetical protein